MILQLCDYIHAPIFGLNKLSLIIKLPGSLVDKLFVTLFFMSNLSEIVIGFKIFRVSSHYSLGICNILI